MRIRTVIGLILLAFCIVCRFCLPAADFYAVRLYPVISGTASFIASAFPFSLEEFVVLGFVAALVAIVVKAVRRRQKFAAWAGRILMWAVWVLVWFYMGWGNNYYRTGLYERNAISRARFDEAAFKTFLDNFTEQLNAEAAAAGDYDPQELEAEARAFYSDQASRYGYCALKRWQHVKSPVFNRLFSAVAIAGYMGPFFCESQVNRDLPPVEYPYVAAHELAHLAGVTSEAEASYWGFAFCRQSGNSAVRYSGFLSLYPYVISHARAFLTEEEYRLWSASVCDKAKEDLRAARERSAALQVEWIEKIQRWMQNLLLTSNGVRGGITDYYGVVSIVMTMDAAGKP